MSRFSFVNGLRPTRLINAIARRGVEGTAFHGLRRAGTVLENAIMGPEVVRINPMTYICNHKCPMCWLQHLETNFFEEQKKLERENGMRVTDYQTLFDQFPVGVREVNVVGGGEPFVHPEAIEIMADIKRHGWYGSLISNGTLMKESHSRRMVEMGWDSVRISVHGGDADTYQRIQGVDRFDTMLKNLKTFNRLRNEMGKAAQCQLTVFHVLQRDNLHCVEKLFEVAEEVGADAIEFDKIIPYDESFFLTADELREMSNKLRACARDSRVPCNDIQIFDELQVEEKCAAEHKPFIPAKSCSVGFDQTFITADGDVVPCCFSNEVMGNVRETPFHQIWFGEKYRNFRSRLINGKFAKYCMTNRCTLPGVLHN